VIGRRFAVASGSGDGLEQETHDHGPDEGEDDGPEEPARVADAELAGEEPAEDAPQNADEDGRQPSACGAARDDRRGQRAGDEPTTIQPTRLRSTG
jgi:hypothetical protein